MTTKPPLQKILQVILYTEDESKQNHKRRRSIKPQEKKKIQRVAFIQLHTIKPLNNKK
jgi:hypothetical protein